MSEKLRIELVREEADPLCLRASIGGTREFGYYLTWRADSPLEMIEMLQEVTKAAEDVLPTLVRPQG